MKWNLPNILTMARLALLPVVLWQIWPPHVGPRHAFWAAMTYIFAGAFDMIDGYIARRTNQVTAFGQFLDPLADKLFYLVTLVALLQLPGVWVPAWVVMVAISRELAITGLRGIAVAEGIVIPAGSGGKVKTTFATAGMACLLFHYPYVIHLGFGDFVVDAHKAGVGLTYLSVFFSVTSAIGYVRGFAQARRPISEHV
jgi:CDP-diacylglycerol--glycerol-3-phosphate 3-phosphatidyltransferase